MESEIHIENQIDLNSALRHYFGFDQFKGEQEAIIRNVLNGKNTFVIMPTGGGKSMCYQLPSLLMNGTAIIVSPLIALMKNQVDQMVAFGINAQFLNSSLTRAEINRVKSEVINGQVKLLYIAPESLNKQENLINLNFDHCFFETRDCTSFRLASLPVEKLSSPTTF